MLADPRPLDQGRKEAYKGTWLTDSGEKEHVFLLACLTSTYVLFCRSFNLPNFKHSIFLFPQYPEGFLEAQAKKEEEKKKQEKVKEQEKESGKGKGKGKGKRKRSEGRFKFGIKDDSPFTMR